MLENGQDGRDGSFGIFIRDQKGHVTGPFSSPFKVELVDFDVIDGNEDGIFEFGEEIILKNIQVKNSGFLMSGVYLIDFRGCSNSKISLYHDERNSDILGFSSNDPGVAPLHPKPLHCDMSRNNHFQSKQR
jgi:hypothetical protein